jgi:hypothetical protein
MTISWKGTAHCMLALLINLVIEHTTHEVPELCLLYIGIDIKVFSCMLFFFYHKYAFLLNSELPQNVLLYLQVFAQLE